MGKLLHKINNEILRPSDVKALIDLNPYYKNFDYDFELGKWTPNAKHKRNLKKYKENFTKKEKSLNNKDYDLIRKAVIKRDNGICAHCGMIGDLQVHHLIYRANGGNDELDNLISLCVICHYDVHKNETVGNIMKKRLISKGLMKKTNK